jgi:hypothetical protein
VVRTLPELIESWDDAEVARRWLQVFPGRSTVADEVEEVHELAIGALCADRDRLAACRRRLRDLSWFMRALNEPIARRANQEDECTGRFWEGRFGCQKLDDAGAALACMAYVDLNPVRAGMADTPEESRYTSVRDRTMARQARRRLDRAPEHPTPEQAALIAQARADAGRDAWLADIGPPAAKLNSKKDNCSGGAGSLPPLLVHLSLDHYLELIDWTGRQIRSDKRGHLSPELRPVLERLDLDVEAWVDNVARYGGLFQRIAGKLERLGELAQRAGRAWFQGQQGARRLYSTGSG